MAFERERLWNSLAQEEDGRFNSPARLRGTFQNVIEECNLVVQLPIMVVRRFYFILLPFALTFASEGPKKPNAPSNNPNSCKTFYSPPGLIGRERDPCIINL
ncbi:hypothetical protein D5R40_34040 [Okeania hirsuta]|uniref:Uncharacterized protein n=1 Tax=Okeania hirsuta TaxID=1458930 RepID=A0A3N6NGD4_9CYAN|nr:hypothetical protein D5R40_34040 [Okeania hirsuta]